MPEAATRRRGASHLVPRLLGIALRSAQLLRATAQHFARLLPIALQLKEALSKNAARVVDLFREWDTDGDGSISKKEFRRAMPMLGFDVPVKDIDALFDANDPDGSGEMDFKELKRMLKGKNVEPTQGEKAVKGAASAVSAVSAFKKAGKKEGAEEGGAGASALAKLKAGKDAKKT